MEMLLEPLMQVGLVLSQNLEKASMFFILVNRRGRGLFPKYRRKECVCTRARLLLITLLRLRIPKRNPYRCSHISKAFGSGLLVSMTCICGRCLALKLAPVASDDTVDDDDDDEGIVYYYGNNSNIPHQRCVQCGIRNSLI